MPLSIVDDSARILYPVGMIANSLRDRRGRRNRARPDLNLSEMADRLEIHPSRLSRLLNGVLTPSLQEALKLAPELGVSVEELPKELERYRKRIREQTQQSQPVPAGKM